MPSKMSLYNKEILLQIGRNAGWISIIYFLGLLFMLPIKILMIYSDERTMSNYQKGHLFQFDFTFQIGLMVIVTVILAVFIFRFLHVKQAVDMIHSLPLKRSRIFHTHAITGVGFFILPVFVIALILMLFHAILDVGSLYAIKDVWYWTGTTIVINLILYTASVFIAMMTGISIIQVVLSYIFLFFPAGFAMLLFYNLKYLLYGFPSDYFLNQQLERLSPITYASVLDGKVFQWKDAAVYLILTLILYGLAVFFYKKRNLEAATEAIAFPKLRSVFQYGVTFCMMLLGGSYFREISFNNGGWTIFGYIIGAAVGYFLAAMVLRKTWRVFSRVKGLGVYLVIIAIFGFGIHTLGFYENRIPNEADIKGALLTDQFYSYQQVDSEHLDAFTPKPLKEKENIEAVLKLHKQILADRNITKDKKYKPATNFYIRYELKNGRKVMREYNVDQRLYDDFFKPIYESPEYKRSTAEIFKVKESKIKSINITANGPVGRAVTLADPKEIKAAVEALKKDVLAETYEDSIYYNGRGSMIDIYISKDQFVHLDMKPSYSHIAKWLKEKNLLERVTVAPEDVDYVLVAKGDFSKIDDPDELKRMLEKQRGTLKVTDEGQIEQLLNKGGTDSSMKYTAVVCYKAMNIQEELYFDEEHAPGFVKNHF